MADEAVEVIVVAIYVQKTHGLLVIAQLLPTTTRAEQESQFVLLAVVIGQ